MNGALGRSARVPSGNGEEPRVHPIGQGFGRVVQIAYLVEDIDAVLEENAEEFVKNYVQRGGQ